MLQQMIEQRDDVLIGCRTGIDDVVAALEAFVVRRIPEQRVMLLEKRDDFLPAGRRIAPDDMADVLPGQQISSASMVSGEFPPGSTTTGTSSTGKSGSPLTSSSARRAPFSIDRATTL